MKIRISKGRGHPLPRKQRLARRGGWPPAWGTTALGRAGTSWVADQSGDSQYQTTDVRSPRSDSSGPASDDGGSSGSGSRCAVVVRGGPGAGVVGILPFEPWRVAPDLFQGVIGSAPRPRKCGRRSRRSRSGSSAPLPSPRFRACARRAASSPGRSRWRWRGSGASRSPWQSRSNRPAASPHGGRGAGCPWRGSRRRSAQIRACSSALASRSGWVRAVALKGTASWTSCPARRRRCLEVSLVSVSVVKEGAVILWSVSAITTRPRRQRHPTAVLEIAARPRCRQV